MRLQRGELLKVRVIEPIGDGSKGIYRGELYAPVYNGKTLVLPKDAECEVASVPQSLGAVTHLRPSQGLYYFTPAARDLHELSA